MSSPESPLQTTQRPRFDIRLTQPGPEALAMGGYTVRMPEGLVFEPDTFYVDDIDVPESQQGFGLGHELVVRCVEEARSKGYSLMRLETINPRIVSTLNTISREGILKDMAFVPTRGIEPVAITSPAALESDQRVGAERAVQYLDENNAKFDAAVAGEEEWIEHSVGVLCVAVL